MRAELVVFAANVAVVALQALALLVARLVEAARDRKADRSRKDRYVRLKRARMKRGEPHRGRSKHVAANRVEDLAGNASRWSSHAPGVR